MNKIKNIALVAHDNCKQDLAEWVKFNKGTLSEHNLVCTGTTGRMIKDIIADDKVNITLLKSGPLGGDQQLGSLIVNGDVDVMIFFWDPMQPQAHDVDIKALLRITVLYNIPVACNRSTADFIISSKLFKDKYEPIVEDYSDYIKREIK
jgi:methylglyoxal synthase